jgi:DNA-binding CsgD family transcriptional regulator
VRLLERQRELTVLRDGLQQVRSGLGTGFALAGDSGTGKSSTIAAALSDVNGLRVVRGQCDPLRTPRPLGPFRELGLPGLSALASVEETRLTETAEQALLELGSEPTVLVIEDLHWADAASTDVLRYLARRVETVPLALLLSYRDREIGPRHAARQLLGDFASMDGLRTLVLQPLSVDAVAEAVRGTGLDPARVHQLTGGNPFYVNQVALEPNRPLPSSVRDAVLARVAGVEPRDLEVLQLIACSPDRLDDRVLPLVGVDLDTLRRLDETTLLTHTDNGIAFRHELARQAIESTIPPGGLPRLHQRLMHSLEQLEPTDPAALMHHALAARDVDRTLSYARAAAAEAVATASNTEAAAFLEVALEHLPSTAPALERAMLLMRLSQQQYLTARLSDALASASASVPLWTAAGRQDGLAEAHAAMAVLEYQLGRRGPSNRHAALACEIADTLSTSATVGRVFADAGMLALVGSDLARAVECGHRADAAGVAAGLDEFVVAGQMLVAGVDCFCAVAGARERVVEMTDAARRRGWDELAWRGYVLLWIHDIERGDLRSAQRTVDEAITHTTDRDLSTARLWHLSFRAITHAHMGRWSAAREDARKVVASGALEGAIWPHLALAQIALRVGDEDPAEHLTHGWSVALGVDEPMRYLPMLAVLAEASWLSGRPDSRVTDFAVTSLTELGTSPETRWSVGNLVVWLRRLGLDVSVAGDLPEPYRSQLAGRHVEAASWWRRAGAPFQEAMSLLDSSVPDVQVQGLVVLDRLGAAGTADRVRRELRRAGVLNVPTRPNETTRTNPGGLTNRQLDVARLLARGLTNSEIAAEAFISTKTAEHHVSAVLAKLGLPNRRAVQLHAVQLGLD